MRLAIPRLPRPFDGMTIAQISDLHAGDFTNAERLRAVVDTVLGLEPDLVVVTGDFITHLRSDGADIVRRELSRLRGPLGILGVLGNHDYWSSALVVGRAVRAAGLNLMRNSHEVIARDGERIYIVGVDDVWERQNDLGKAMQGVPVNACAFLLAHEPDFADEACVDRRLVLQLSGHSHGGQVRLPGLGAPHLPNMGRKYPEGLRKVGQMWLYTNRGIGVVFPPLRVNCPPEVTLFELAPEA